MGKEVFGCKPVLVEIRVCSHIEFSSGGMRLASYSMILLLLLLLLLLRFAFSLFPLVFPCVPLPLPYSCPLSQDTNLCVPSPLAVCLLLGHSFTEALSISMLPCLMQTFDKATPVTPDIEEG